MLPVIALVGRPNVGKSTLFNLLTRSRDALVADQPGLTRDRQYGFGKVGPRGYLVVDTGGFEVEQTGLPQLMARQTRQAIEEADAAILMVDARDGLTAADEDVAVELRKTGKPVFLAVNKSEGLESAAATMDFHALGMGEPCAISSAHGRGVETLIADVLAGCPEDPGAEDLDDAPGTRVAVIGRPNVGKSTLINRIVGEERVVAFDQPGTTRDSVFVPFERDGTPYTLIDTAGVRRRSKVAAAIEKFSIVKTLQAIDRAHVVIAVLDAHEGITDQDASLLGLVVDRGRAVVVAINKWDGIAGDQRDTVRRQLDLKLSFLGFARFHFISALHGTGVGDLFGSVDEAYAAATASLPTAELTRVLEAAVIEHQPPLVRGRRIKLRYAHQGGRNPPVIVLHGTQTEKLPDAYRRYLINRFRREFDLFGTPLRLELKSSKNPYAGRRNKLTPRQQQKKKRLARFVKRKS